MPRVISTKRQKYNSRNVSLGDVFVVKDNHYRLLKALGWIKDMPVVEGMSVESNPELVPKHIENIVKEPFVDHHSVVEKSKDEDTNQAETPIEGEANEASPINETMLKDQDKQDSIQQSLECSRMLRERASNLGIRVDGRWSDARVQREIDEHNKSRYQRMDLRSEG